MTPADLRKVISLQVTVTQIGYTDAVASSANTSPVAPGTFLNTREPAVVGTAQVGVPLTADKGAWTPKASVAYQWVVGGTEVAGATSKSFTPRPQDLGLPVTVEIMASRPGYLTALVTSQATAATLPGVFRSTKAPGDHRTTHGRPHPPRIERLLVARRSHPLLPVVRRRDPDQGRHRGFLPADRGRGRTADPRRRHRLRGRVHL